MNSMIRYNPKPLLIPAGIGIYGLYKKNIYIGSTATIIAMIIMYFHRVPRIQVTYHSPNIITSPTYGTIKRIHQINKHQTSIEIFLSLFDVHVQYIPIHQGIVTKQIYIEGTFKPAFILKKSEYNERMITTIHTPNVGDVIVEQIAGILARRIFNFVDICTDVYRGKELGFISFGSRVDVTVDTQKIHRICCIKEQHVTPNTVLIEMVKKT